MLSYINVPNCFVGRTRRRNDATAQRVAVVQGQRKDRDKDPEQARRENRIQHWAVGDSQCRETEDNGTMSQVLS